MTKKINLILSGLFVLCIMSSCDPPKEEDETQSTERTAQTLSEKALSRLSPAFRLPAEPGNFPRSLEADGQMRLVPSKDWCSGFYPGILWFAYELSGEESYKELAGEWTKLVEPEKTNAGTHDMGFKINCSFGNAYRITEDSYYKEVMLESAATLATRYNEKVGSIRSWDFNKDVWSFPVIIDNMMNLELLFKATQLSGDSTYYHMAYQHAMTTLENHFREDNSSVHVVDYDPGTGQALSKVTHQGLSDGSSWARGQAWGLYGFTMAYRFTKEEQFLQQAVKIYDYIFTPPNLPEDQIPYWDYDAPKSANTPRDASAAAITASALYELADYSTDTDMVKKADKILETLGSEKYLTDASADHIFILDHGTGNMPKEDEMDTPLIYGDYYFMEALLRQKQQEKK